MSALKLMIVDDHRIVRESLGALLNKMHDFEVVEIAENGQEAIDLALSKQVDIVLMDINMPVMDGINASMELRRRKPEIKIIALTLYDDYYYIEKMLKAGASGYLAKDSSYDELVSAIISVGIDNKQYLCQSSSNVMINSVIKQQEDNYYNISAREKEILELIASGLTNKEIASNLCLSVSTIDSHRANLLRKLDAKNSIDMINKAYQKGILS